MKELSRWTPMACLILVLSLGLVIAACNDAPTPTEPSPFASSGSTVAPGGSGLGAGTPDGEPPAAEEDCSDLTGAAFGLCNSYCEAMDCDLEIAGASAQACEEVRAQYFELTGEEPPCEDGGPSGSLCGNNICNAGDGEDCVSCPADCRGVQGGKPANRYCCGDGDGQNPVPCGDPRCTALLLSCINEPTLP